MSKYGPKTYGRRQECKSNVQFDQLFSDNKNKPSTAKVSAGVQRWGVATFTSLRKTQLNGQKEHGEEGNSKRFKADPVLEKSRTKPVGIDDPFSFDLDKDSSPVKMVASPITASPVSCLVEKKAKASAGSKPNKFFKSRPSAKNLATHNNPKFNPTVVLEKTFRYDTVQSQALDDFVHPAESVTTQPTVIKIMSPVKTNTETKRDAAKPSAFDLLLTQDSNVITSNAASRTEEDWFSLFDNVKADVQTNSDVYVVNKSDHVNSSPDVDILSKRTESDQPCFTDKSSLSDEMPMEISSPPAARTYSRNKNATRETSAKSNTGGLPHAEDHNALPRYQDKLVSPMQTLSSQVSDLNQLFDDACIVLSDSGTPSSSQETSVSEAHETDSCKKGEKSRRSIFKSRNILNSSNKKKFLYKHRPWQDDDKDEMELSKEPEKPTLSEEFEDEIQEKPDLTLSKRVTKKISYASRETITSWKCDRKARELYTVVHNVKQAYQCHESGETQEFNDEVEYLLEGIQPKSSIGTRCLSTVGWATKCMLPSFRIHLRAHGTIPRVFSALMDAPSDPGLSLCTATLMFVLSQDRLTMDLEANTLSLMLQLLEAGPGEAVDSPYDSQSAAGNSSETISFHQASKMKEKVRQLCEEMQQKGYARQLNLENITTGNLAMETLLSLTSRKAGEWFKEGIRNLGGLDYIVDAVNACIQRYCLHGDTIRHPTEADLSDLKKIDRCLRVLENVTYMDSDNQTYLLQYKKAVLVSCCFSLLQVCRGNIAHNPIPHDGSGKSASKSSTGNLPGSILLACILSLLKVFLNLTHESGTGSSTVGSREGLLNCILLCILQVPQFIPPEERFDLLVLALGLLINLMEQCEENRDRMVFIHTLGSFDSPNNGEELSALEALVEVFLGRVESARQSEEQADALLDAKPADNSKKSEDDQNSTPSSSQQSQAEEFEETLMKALHKAGKNMEHSIIAAYIALLLGCIIQNKEYADLVRDHMPNGNFNAMVEILRKFLNFVSLTGVVGPKGLKSIQRVLKVLESS